MDGLESFDVENEAEALRARLTADRVRTEALARAFGVTARSIYNYAKLGLPHIRLGTERWYSISEVETWLANRPRVPRPTKSSPTPLPPPRGRGRPRALPVG